MYPTPLLMSDSNTFFWTIGQSCYNLHYKYFELPKYSNVNKYIYIF